MSLEYENILPNNATEYPNEWVAYFKGDKNILDHDASPAQLFSRISKQESVRKQKAILFFNAANNFIPANSVSRN